MLHLRQHPWLTSWVSCWVRQQALIHPLDLDPLEGPQMVLVLAQQHPWLTSWVSCWVRQEALSHPLDLDLDLDLIHLPAWPSSLRACWTRSEAPCLDLGLMSSRGVRQRWPQRGTKS